MNDWLGKITGALVVLLMAAVVARGVWELLRPIVPTFVTFTVVLGILRLMISRRRYW